MGFGAACLEMVREHTAEWVFATVHSIKVRHTFYYGFAREIKPPGRTLWFKDGLERRQLGFGPVQGSTADESPPDKGTLLVGRAVPQDPGRFRYDWWYRDAAPFRLLVQVAHGEWQGRASELREQARCLPDRQLDNLWVLIRMIMMEDLDVLAEHRELLRLDRPKERFVCDVCLLFGLPAIFQAYGAMLQRFHQPSLPTPEAQQAMAELDEMAQDANEW